MTTPHNLSVVDFSSTPQPSIIPRKGVKKGHPLVSSKVSRIRKLNSKFLDSYEYNNDHEIDNVFTSSGSKEVTN